MPVEKFREIAEKIKPFTDYVYLHVLGEPLLHPQLGEIIQIACNAGLQVNLTTNGALIERKKDILYRLNIRQINISLHDAEENLKADRWPEYIESVLDFTQKMSETTYMNLRLWNGGEADSTAFNKLCYQTISNQYGIPVSGLQLNSKDTGIKLAKNTFLQPAARFEWPDGQKLRNPESKNCYALRTQMAILLDGTIVPCCMDANGAIALGNIFEQDLSEVINSERALKIKTGFENGKITEDFCRSCGFIV